MERRDVVVCGAGCWGLAAAWMARQAGLSVAVIDDGAPVSSDPRGLLRPYSVWDPGLDPDLFRLASRGIDILETIADLGRGAVAVSRRGELILAASESDLAVLRASADRVAFADVGPVREHVTAELVLPIRPTGFRGVPGGFDWFGSNRALRSAFPFLGPRAAGGLHVRRAGWVDSAALRRWLLNASRAAGVDVIHDAITAVEPYRDRGRLVRFTKGNALIGDTVVIAGGTQLRAWLRQATAAGVLVKETRHTVTCLRSHAIVAPDLVIPSDRDSCLFRVARPGTTGAVLASWVTSTRRTVGESAAALGGLLSRYDESLAVDSSLAEHTEPLATLPDGRPLMGPISEGLYLLLGDDSLSTCFAVADLLVDLIASRETPGFAGAVSPERVPDLAGLLKKASERFGL